MLNVYKINFQLCSATVREELCIDKKKKILGYQWCPRVPSTLELQIHLHFPLLLSPTQPPIPSLTSSVWAKDLNSDFLRQPWPSERNSPSFGEFWCLAFLSTPLIYLILPFLPVWYHPSSHPRKLLPNPFFTSPYRLDFCLSWYHSSCGFLYQLLSHSYLEILEYSRLSLSPSPSPRKFLFASLYRKLFFGEAFSAVTSIPELVFHLDRPHPMWLGNFQLPF